MVANTLRTLTSLLPLVILANCASVDKSETAVPSNAPVPQSGLPATSAALYTLQEGQWQQTRLDLEVATPKLEEGVFVLNAKADTSVWGYNPYTYNYDKLISRAGTQSSPSAKRSATLSVGTIADQMKLAPSGHRASTPNQDQVQVAIQIDPDPETSAAEALLDGSPITVTATATVAPNRKISVSKRWTLKIQPEQDPELVEAP